jgi:hypothetical protein
VTDVGWCIDDGPDEAEDDFWDDNPYDEDDDYEPDWGYIAEMQQWQREQAVQGRERRRIRRRYRHQDRLWRKTMRHANDRFWQARNRPSFDDEAPF